MSAMERTGWRDEELSHRHRLYGSNCPACDIDFMLIEYDSCIPKGVVDYKKGIKRKAYLQDANLRAMALFGSMAGLPAWLAFYDDHTWDYRVIPLNESAEQFFVSGEQMTEKEYVARLYKIRGRVVPAGVLEKLEAHYE